jgi:hypothetical protein
MQRAQVALLKELKNTQQQEIQLSLVPESFFVPDLSRLENLRLRMKSKSLDMVITLLMRQILW